MARKISFDAPVPEPSAMSAAQGARIRPLLGMDRPVRPTSALGAISQSLGGMTDKVKRADELEQKLIQGQTIVELDPALIDNSFVADRMDAPEEQHAAFRELIRQHGQNVPILVRPHPGEITRYEVAFGHRRLRAARELGIKVRAVIRPMTDEELVIAQGQENSGRTDLTFIERARFAARLEERKFSRAVIMAALNVDKAALSRLIAIATRIPSELIEAIGPAPAFGRVRWQELLDLMEQTGRSQQALAITASPGFKDQDSDKRFEALMAGLRARPERTKAEVWSAADGTHAARVSRTGKKLSLIFDDRVAPHFGDFIQSRLQSLYDEYKAAGRDR